ncbi:MAG TPA: hypothetical protein VGE53_01535 [Candidatus Paceibacterota bacterium]
MNWQGILVSIVFIAIGLALILTRFKMGNPFHKDAPDSDHETEKHGHGHGNPSDSHGKKSPGHHDEHKHHSAHGHDDHHGGSNPFVLMFIGAGILVVIVVIGWWLSTRVAPPNGKPIAERIAMAPQGTLSGNQVALTSSVRCVSMDVVARVIPPGDEVVVAIPDGRSLEFEPGTSEGTLRVCDAFNPSVCANGQGLKGGIRAARMENISSDPVHLRCRLY